MEPNTIYILQAVGFFLQIVNAGMSGVIQDPVISLLASAFVGAFQFYLQRAGILVEPPKK